MLYAMIRSLLRCLRPSRLARRRDYQHASRGANALLDEARALERQLAKLLELAYANAPVIRIHHGAPPQR
jgi:hypothetical protein